MHYCCLIITKEFPTNDLLNEILKPYYEEDFYNQENYENLPYPVITWDYWQLGGRYDGQIKLIANPNDNKYRWKYYEYIPRAGRLFRSALLEYRIKEGNCEEDYFNTMGYRDGYIYVDGAKIKDIQNLDKIGCFSFIDKNGTPYTRSYYNHGTFIDNPEFEKQLKKAFNDSQDCYVSCIDLHD